MGWLSNWLQDLIMIVLLATFVDMLLPNRSMERYVKLVLSLLILLTLLSPITKLLRSDPVGELKRAMTAMEAPQDEQTLEKILAQGKRMQASEQKESLKWTAKELANVMKGQIEETTSVKVQSVNVQLVMKKQELDTEVAAATELPVIQQVIVQLAPEAAGSKPDSERAEPVNSQPMSGTTVSSEDSEHEQGTRPIQIDAIEIANVQIESSGEESSSKHLSDTQATDSSITRDSSTSSDDEQASASPSEHAVQIITLLKEKWKVDASQVRVTQMENAEVL